MLWDVGQAIKLALNLFGSRCGLCNRFCSGAFGFQKGRRVSLLAEKLHGWPLTSGLGLLLAVGVDCAIDSFLEPLAPKRDTLCPFWPGSLSYISYNGAWNQWRQLMSRIQSILSSGEAFSKGTLWCPSSQMNTTDTDATSYHSLQVVVTSIGIVQCQEHPLSGLVLANGRTEREQCRN